MDTAGDTNFGTAGLAPVTSLVTGFTAAANEGEFIGARSKYIRLVTPSDGNIKLFSGTGPAGASLMLEGTGKAQMFGPLMCGIGTAASSVVCAPGLVGIVGALMMGPVPATPPALPEAAPPGIQAGGIAEPLKMGDIQGGSNPSEPYVLWSQLEPFLRAIMEDLNGISSPLETLPDGSPAPGTGESAMNFDSLAIASTYEPMLAAMPSTKIFGE